MVYFSQKQGDTLNGFKSIQYDDSTVDKAIASTNNEVGDWASPVYEMDKNMFPFPIR